MIEVGLNGYSSAQLVESVWSMAAENNNSNTITTITITAATTTTTTC